MKLAEARAALMGAIRGHDRDVDDPEAILEAEDLLDEAVSVFAAAVREGAFEEMRAEAERRFEAHANMEPGYAVAYGRLADWAKQQAEKASGR